MQLIKGQMTSYYHYHYQHKPKSLKLKALRLRLPKSIQSPMQYVQSAKELRMPPQRKEFDPKTQGWKIDESNNYVIDTNKKSQKFQIFFIPLIARQ